MHQRRVRGSNTAGIDWMAALSHRYRGAFPLVIEFTENDMKI